MLNLADRFSGKLFVRGEDGYEVARINRIFHSRHPERYPAAVLQAASENDVVEGVLLAKEKGWKVSVRSGGHSFPVWSVRDDGLMIDLGNIKEMTYDPETRVATASPAVQGGHELTPYLKQFGRFFQTGGCPSVGLGGFLVQGGAGWNLRGWGWAAEQIVAIDVVTADGELVRADEQQNADLFWAARGSGPGFFGVITRFHLRTRPIAQGLMGTMHFYPLELYPEVLAWLWETQRSISPEVYLTAASAKVPVPGLEGQLVFTVNAAAFCGSYEESHAALAPLADCPYIDRALLVMPPAATSIEEQLVFIDAAHPAGLHYRVDSAWVDGPIDDVIAATKMLVEERPYDELGYTFFLFLLPREAPDMAMSLQSELCVGAYMVYPDPADDERVRLWSLEAMHRLEPYTIGQGWGDSDQSHRSVKVLTDDAWARLQKIRAARDPDHRFVGYLSSDVEFQNLNAWELDGAPA